MVATRDVTAGHTVSFIDEEATIARQDMAARRISAVFRFSADANRQIQDSWDSFCDFAEDLRSAGPEAAHIAIDAGYPGYFPRETLNIFLSIENRANFKDFGSEIITAVLRRGIFLVSGADISQFNPETAEIVNPGISGRQREIVRYDNITTVSNVRQAIGNIVMTMNISETFKNIAVDMIAPFMKENVFFSPSESQRRIEEVKNTIDPAVRIIEKGTRIIRKGFIITDAEMNELNALYTSSPRKDPRNVIGSTLLVFMIYFLIVILSGKIIIGRKLNDRERYMIAILAGSYIIGSILLNNISPGFEGFPVSLFIPTSLVIMIFAVFLGTRYAIAMSLALPLCAYLTGAFDFYSYVIALVSGIAASTVLHKSQNRMSLIKAGLQIAAVNCLAVIIVLLLRQSGWNNYPAMLFAAVLNGIFSGMLTIGFLPPLEHILNAVTPFRLMELSDLNAPVLRKLFTAAPGTYSHSLMVANLAEQACQDIGANALLARVGAYYHDIGKMENPDYFVENQTDHNRHDEIAPRLSATIIRSHVKLGVEKAYSLGFPKDVIDIISEHHGNSVISWFYNKAAETETDVSTEDFTYPGNPPHTKESAVVMLADVTEAAVRTLTKPSAGKIEKFIQQLFDSKSEHGQLAESDLSFRDLEIIKKAFVKVLTGYYHSRIEYPNQKEEE